MKIRNERGALSRPLKLSLEAVLTAGYELERITRSEVEETNDFSDGVSPATVDFHRKVEALLGDHGNHPLVEHLSKLWSRLRFDRFAEGQSGQFDRKAMLLSFLVPIERLLGRHLKDEEFLFDDSDRVHPPIERKAQLGDQRRAIVACENLRSDFNVGSIYRTAECFAFDEVWRVGYTPAPHRSAMGADSLLRSREFLDSDSMIETARSEGLAVIGLEKAPGSVAIQNFQWPDRFVMVLGNERFGLNSQTRSACDATVHIDLFGQKNSLNVGTAFGVAAAQEVSSRGHVTFEPIGKIETSHKKKQASPRQASRESSLVSADSRENESRILLNAKWKSRNSNFQQALGDLEGFSHIWVLFAFHKVDKYRPMVIPPRSDGKKKGVFSTRSPHRPNPIGLSSVRLLGVDTSRRSISIGPCDLLDGTPILDIKPYLPDADSVPGAAVGWLEDLKLTAYRVMFEESASQQLSSFMQTTDGHSLAHFIQEQLTYRPLDSRSKRIEIKSRHETKSTRENISERTHSQGDFVEATIAFERYRIDYVVFEAEREVYVQMIHCLDREMS